tara:strand:+ start:600 stop:908 length:309 start_codon:yes stop_codon:yes gene_type:complete
MSYVPLEEILKKCKPDKRFTLDTQIRDFVKIIEKETDIPPRLRLLLVRHGYKGWRNFDTMQDLILSYRNGIQWSEKSRGILSKILTKYGFYELAAKRYARSR